MTHGSLFSGIGGFDLAAEWMGWHNVFSCEIDPFCQQVLQHHWPNVDHHTDIFDFNATQYLGRIDILTGGFPCQPFSSAGKRKGKKDERYLFPEMCRIVRECRPTYVVAENVRGLLNLGGGVEFIAVCDELESCGYELQTFCVPAAGKGAPHRRDRIWIVAHACGGVEGLHHGTGRGKAQSDGGQNAGNVPDSRPGNGVVANAQHVRLEHGTFSRGMGEIHKGIRGDAQTIAADGWAGFPSQSPVCGGDDGLSLGLDGITFPKWRKETLKAMGNAIVPQVAYEIFKAIERHETKF